MRDVGKCPVAVIVKEMQRGTPPVLPGPVHAIGEKQILPSVSVIVDERDARSEGFRKIFLSERAGVMSKRETGGLRDVRKLNCRGSGPAHDMRGRQREQCDDEAIKRAFHFKSTEVCSCIACRSLLSSGWVFL